MNRAWVAPFAFAAFMLLWPSSGRAYDVNVDIDTGFQAYEVRSPRTRVFWARRRLVDTLGLRFVQPLTDAEIGPPGPTIHAQLRLRLYQDFGHTCLVSQDICVNATDSGDPDTYEPHATDSLVDAPLGYVEAVHLPGRMTLRGGRQLHWDRMGFARVDGLSGRLEPWPWLTLEAIGGALVQDDSLAGSPAFLPQGVRRIDASGPGYGYAEGTPFMSPATMWVAGGSADAGLSEVFRAGLSYRQVSDETGLISRTGGPGVVLAALHPLHLEADGAWDLADGAFADARAAARLQVGSMTYRARVQRHVPRFDWGTIWAFFPSARTWHESLGASWEASSRLVLGGAVQARHVQFASDTDHEGGLEGNAWLRIGAFRLQVTAFGWAGDLGPMWGGDAQAWRHVLAQLVLELRLSLWRVRDWLTTEREGTSISETLAARLEVTENTSFLAELAHAHSGAVGHRFSLLAVLRIGVWR